MTVNDHFWSKLIVFPSLFLTVTLGFFGGQLVQSGSGFGVLIMLVVIAPHILRLEKTNWRLPLVFLIATLTTAVVGYALT